MGDLPGQEVEDASRFGIDRERLGAFLAGAGFGFAGLRAVRKFATGQSNPTFRLDADSGQYVMRCKPKGSLLKSAHMIEREYALFEALQGTEVPVPRVHLYCKDPSVVGSEFFVMEFVRGRVFADVTLCDVEAQDRRDMYEHALRALATIHSVPPSRVAAIRPSQRDGAPALGYYARQINRLAAVSEQQEAGGAASLPRGTALFRWAAERVPADGVAETLVHGDFKLDNIVFAPDAARVRAVLDWEMSTAGHPLADLANFCMFYVLPESLPLPTLASGLPPGVPSCEECLMLYHAARGAVLPTPRAWQFALAFAVLKMAVILQGVAYRAAKGQASSAKAAAIGGFAASLADTAWRVAQADPEHVPGCKACVDPARARL